MERKINVQTLTASWGGKIDVSKVFYVLRDSLHYPEAKYEFDVTPSKIKTDDGKTHLVFTTNTDDREALRQQASQLKRMYSLVHEIPGVTYLRYRYVVENKTELFIKNPEKIDLNHFEDDEFKDGTRISEITVASIIQVNYKKCILSDISLLNRLLHWIYVPKDVNYTNPYEIQE